jgi:hypothetical protein
MSAYDLCIPFILTETPRSTETKCRFPTVLFPSSVEFPSKIGSRPARSAPVAARLPGSFKSPGMRVAATFTRSCAGGCHIHPARGGFGVRLVRRAKRCAARRGEGAGSGAGEGAGQGAGKRSTVRCGEGAGKRCAAAVRGGARCGEAEHGAAWGSGARLRCGEAVRGAAWGSGARLRCGEAVRGAAWGRRGRRCGEGAGGWEMGDPRATPARSWRAARGPAGQGRSTRGSGDCQKLAGRRPGGLDRQKAASWPPPHESDNYACTGPPPFPCNWNVIPHGAGRQGI